MEGVVFGDGDADGGAVAFAGAGVDDSLGAKCAGGVNNVHRAFDIGTDVAAGGRITVGDGNEGGKVEDDFLPGHGFDDGFVIADISGVDSDVFDVG